MKVFELTIAVLGLYIRREDPNPLTEDHKFYIAIGLICLVAVLGFFGMFNFR